MSAAVPVMVENTIAAIGAAAMTKAQPAMSMATTVHIAR